MLLGCCHCDEPVSSSSLSSSSGSSGSSSSSDVEVSSLYTPAFCANCSSLPRRWSVAFPTTGFTFNAYSGDNERHDCGLDNVYGTVILHYKTQAQYPTLYDDYTEPTCAVWLSDELPIVTAKKKFVTGTGYIAHPNMCGQQGSLPEATSRRVLLYLHRYGTISEDKGYYLLRHYYWSQHGDGFSSLKTLSEWSLVQHTLDSDRNCVKSYTLNHSSYSGTNATYTRTTNLPDITLNPA